ncbi:hypothetical protein [Senegalimassilia anaerobia]|uniref:hypothetical protein n=1 Tax=Senegalimassilia anaerobia TaxID=1473216 RepID=UPI003A91795E
MMRPMMRKVAFGVPAVALSAALACTMAGCGGTEGGQGGSGGNAPAGQTANSVQTAEVAGFTIESVGDGSYYRGAVERQDGFWLRVKITNNNESAKAPSTFSARAAVGTFDAGDAVFDASGDQRLNADTKTQAVELGEGAQMDANAKIEPGQSVEFIYFWTTKDNYYGPITVEFDSSSSSDPNPSVMHFDTTGRESDGYKAAREAAEAIEAQGGIDFPSYSIIPADGWKLGDRIDEKYEGCDFKHGDEAISSIDMRTFKTSPMMEAEARQGSKKKGVIDEVEINGVTWVRYTSEAGAVSLFVEAPSGKTVSMVIGSKVTWDDALPMVQNVVLK